MEKSSYYLEIFGNDIDSIAPVLHQRPESDLDNALIDFSKASRTAEIDRLVDTAFVTGLVGDVPTRDAAGIRPTSAQPDAPYLENLLEELLPTSNALASLAPTACASFEKLIKSVRPSRKAVLDGKLAPLYRPELREKWNGMLDKLAAENADALDGSTLLRKATAYLEIAA